MYDGFTLRRNHGTSWYTAGAFMHAWVHVVHLPRVPASPPSSPSHHPTQLVTRLPSPQLKASDQRILQADTRYVFDTQQAHLANASVEAAQPVPATCSNNDRSNS